MVATRAHPKKMRGRPKSNPESCGTGSYLRKHPTSTLRRCVRATHTCKKKSGVKGLMCQLKGKSTGRPKKSAAALSDSAAARAAVSAAQKKSRSDARKRKQRASKKTSNRGVRSANQGMRKLFGSL